MLYGTVRAAARIALHWYYGDVIVQGRKFIPARGSVLVVANHPNALVDALLVGTTLERQVLLTAKATLFEHPLLAPFLRVVGVVPLRRAKDERAVARTGASVSRNEDTFRLVVETLRREGVILVFPEGISHDDATLAPLRSGAARMALQAYRAGALGLRILPIGLVFEEKERARSAVLVRVSEPIDLRAWLAEHQAGDPAALTREIDRKLRRVTLNFATAERGKRAVRLARALAAVSTEPPTVGRERLFPTEALIAARIEAATEALEHSPAELVQAADDFAARLAAFEARLAAKGIALADVRIPIGKRDGVQFVFRETALALLALPFALFGRLLHWLPIRITRAVVMRSLTDDPSRDQPAMRTIVLGTLTVIAWYVLQISLVASWAGIGVGVLWLVTIFGAAQIDLRLSDRLARARRRAQSYLALRADLQFRTEALSEVAIFLVDAVALEQSLVESAQMPS